MIDINACFKNKRPDSVKLIEYGFAASDDVFVGDFPIMNGQYTARITISDKSIVELTVYDAESREEYLLARVKDASGAFVGKIHQECEVILNDISRKCFFAEYFSWEQSKRILRYIKETYGAEPEFLWKNLPESAALRVPGKKSWFAVVGRVDKQKLGLSESGTAEVINLKDEPEAVTARINAHLALPAYHMNKQHWYTVILDDRLPDEEIISMVRTSYISVNE